MTSLPARVPALIPKVEVFGLKELFKDTLFTCPVTRWLPSTWQNWSFCLRRPRRSSVARFLWTVYLREVMYLRTSWIKLSGEPEPSHRHVASLEGREGVHPIGSRGAFSWFKHVR